VKKVGGVSERLTGEEGEYGRNITTITTINPHMEYGVRS
jgi:hypothetical protein